MLSTSLPSYMMMIVVLAVIGIRQGLCDDGANCDACIGVPQLWMDAPTFVNVCICLGSRSESWCFTREDLTEWRYCTAQDRDQGFEVPLHCVPIDCMWASWSEWSECDTDVRTGRLFRFRTRDKIEEVNGGKPCSDGRVEHDDTYCYDACGSSPCMNGGRCVPQSGSYSCTCPEKYTGTNCDAVIQSCPDGYTRENNSCYKISTELSNWIDARRNCLVDGADLVTIDSQIEQDYLIQQLELAAFQESNGPCPYGLWIGLTDAFIEGDFMWISNENQPIYTNWHHGEPSNGLGGPVEHCGHIEGIGLFSGWKWNDAQCASTTMPLCHICEKTIY